MVGRHAKVLAKPGQGDALAGMLIEIAEGLRETPGCELYLINRSPAQSDVLFVTELWQSQELLDAALASEGARKRIPEVMALVREGGFEPIDLEPLGGVGYPATGRGSRSSTSTRWRTWRRGSA